MANRVIALMGSKKIPLEIATEITVKGKTVARRVVDTIDPEVLKVVAQKVERAWNENIMFSASDKAKITKLVITSMPHEGSAADPASHISVAGTDDEGTLYKKGHVSINSLEQQVCPSNRESKEYKGNHPIARL
ncbi:hypothetical protein DV738_g211, partial [Chaetothyriales sp. CBS 135597]